MATIHRLATADASPTLLADIRRLMDDAFEGDFDDDDWDHTVGGEHVVAMDGDELVAHAAVVERVLHVGGVPFRTGYVEGVATRPGRQGQGHGTAVMAEVGERIRAGFELGALGTGEHHFYERLGWERWQGPTFAGPTRTEEDDDGVMVLRFGPSATVDRTAPIACDPRPGDDW